MANRYTVFFLPGFTASDLGVIATGQKIWWEPNVISLLDMGVMRLADDGVTPAPPNGQQLGVFTLGQTPWPQVLLEVRQGLDPILWDLKLAVYDWRLLIETQATQLANGIAATTDPAFPATLVGHSMGGLVAIATYVNLFFMGKQNLIRRIITLGTPFQGSYYAVQMMAGTHPSVEQLLKVFTYGQWNPAVPIGHWTIDFIAGVFATWPALYELLPSLQGPDALLDPNRPLLYNAANWPSYAPMKQKWLDYAKNTWQNTLFSVGAFPPAAVLTCVAGTGLKTAQNLIGADVPLKIKNIGSTFLGDGTVTVVSAIREPCLSYLVTCDHSSLPLGVARTGELAALILDPRVPPAPPVEIVNVSKAKLQNVTDPPESDPVDCQTCIGGHC
jgi:pimeloyl-ACP methyl ester carboxylesterase